MTSKDHLDRAVKIAEQRERFRYFTYLSKKIVPICGSFASDTKKIKSIKDFIEKELDKLLAEDAA